MSDHSFARAEDVQSLGQTPSPNQIGQQIKTLTRKAAEASQIALECHLEIAKLLQMMVDHHGYKSKRFVEFALANGVSSRTDAYDMLLLSEADDVLTTDEADPYRETHRGAHSGARSNSAMVLLSQNPTGSRLLNSTSWCARRSVTTTMHVPTRVPRITMRWRPSGLTVRERAFPEPT